MIHLDGNRLTLDDLVAIAVDRAPVSLTDEARTHVRTSRAVVDAFARGDQPVYGINTGFGNFAEVRIPSDSLSELQVNLLRSHAAGVGDPLPVPVVRATMALRANVLAAIDAPTPLPQMIRPRSTSSRITACATAREKSG